MEFWFSATTRVLGAQIVTAGDHQISIAWDPPSGVERVETYEVKYYSDHFTNNISSVNTMYTNYTFKNLQGTTRYTFEVGFAL